MTTTLPTTTIHFPEIKLLTRDAHKLRGYFGNLFREHSPLLHNHFEDGTSRYEYAKVQYKVLRGTPYLVGIGTEAARLLTELFLDIKELNMDGWIIPVMAKNIEAKTWTIGTSNELHTYRFENLWMALNQRNFESYMSYEADQQADQLRGIAVQNILTVFDAFDLRLPKEDRIMLTLQNIESRKMNFKDTKMLGFKGQFVTNALLPDFIGIGKSVARGYGTIIKV